jgi:hypothetical protein
MQALLTIVWFLSLLISVDLIFVFVGFSGMTQMFPEGKRWWHFPVQLLTLAIFAAVVLFHPFK